MSNLITQWLTMAEAERRAGVHRGTIYRWIKLGRVRSAKTPGGQWRIAADSLDLRPSLTPTTPENDRPAA